MADEVPNATALMAALTIGKASNIKLASLAERDGRRMSRRGGRAGPVSGEADRHAIHRGRGRKAPFTRHAMWCGCGPKLSMLQDGEEHRAGPGHNATTDTRLRRLPTAALAAVLEEARACASAQRARLNGLARKKLRARKLVINAFYDRCARRRSRSSRCSATAHLAETTCCAASRRMNIAQFRAEGRSQGRRRLWQGCSRSPFKVKLAHRRPWITPPGRPPSPAPRRARPPSRCRRRGAAFRKPPTIIDEAPVPRRVRRARRGRARSGCPTGIARRGRCSSQPEGARRSGATANSSTNSPSDSPPIRLTTPRDRELVVAGRRACFHLNHLRRGAVARDVAFSYVEPTRGDGVAREARNERRVAVAASLKAGSPRRRLVCACGSSGPPSNWERADDDTGRRRVRCKIIYMIFCGVVRSARPRSRPRPCLV